MNGAILQQVFVVEFVIQYQMCDDCHRVEAKDFWKAVVQVRQKVGVCGLMIQKNFFFFRFSLSALLFYLTVTFSNIVHACHMLNFRKYLLISCPGSKRA